MTDFLNALTVDVEDYFQVSAFEQDIPRTQWDGMESRVVSSTRRLLALFDRHGLRATFFVLGWVARRFPRLVREIHARGHEIASHGFWHRLIYEQSPKAFRNDLRDSCNILEDILSTPVRAYRAPSFSIIQRSLWALEILVEEGFHIDSSIFPVHHDRYGIPGASPEIHEIQTAAGPLLEFPPPVVRFGSVNLPVGGGGYFRLYPLRLTQFCLARINRVLRRPFVFYLHPWEVDPKQPRLRAGSIVSRFRHRVNLAGTERKLDLLLTRFRFGRLCDAVEQVRPAPEIPEAPRLWSELGLENLGRG